MRKHRSVSSSPRLKEIKKKKRRALGGKALLGVIGLAVIVAGLSYLSRLKALNIGDIQVSGNKVIDSDAITEIVQGDLTGRYFWLFPKTNFLVFPKHKIEKDLTSKFLRAKDITANIRGTDALEINLTERTATYTWCGDSGPVDSEQCYFMDESGYIFAQAPYFSSGVYFKYYGQPDQNSKTPLGSYFMKAKFLDYLALREGIAAIGLKPRALWVKDEGEAEIYLASKTANIPAILFKTDEDVKTITQNLETALATEPLKSNFAKNYGSLQYIDLRFGNKVYYKFATGVGTPTPAQ